MTGAIAHNFKLRHCCYPAGDILRKLRKALNTSFSNRAKGYQAVVSKLRAPPELAVPQEIDDIVRKAPKFDLGRER
jgi:hypothetical protein